MPLTIEEEYRYSRHLVLPGVGAAGQEKLKKARVLLVGAGGLGTSAALYLAAAGIGTLGIVDDDVVDESNLQRQVIHRTSTIGLLKVDSAADAIHDLNPLVKVHSIPYRVTNENVLEVITDYDIIIDGTDNFPTRYMLNDACAMRHRPLVFGSIYQFEGQVSVFDADKGPCYRCLFPKPPMPSSVPSCAEGGVLGVLPGLVGVMQATEALKLILGVGEPLRGRLLRVNVGAMRFQEMRVNKNPDCPLCGTNKTIKELQDYQDFCGMAPSNEKTKPIEISAAEALEMMKKDELTIIDVRDQPELDEDPPLANATHIPYSTFIRQMQRLNSVENILVYCSTGIRSWQAVTLLRRAGFTRCWSIKGGLLALHEQENR